MQALTRTIGPPVSGPERFHGRNDEILRLMSLLDEGNHVLVAAPRRIGKTSLVKETLRRRERDWITLAVDVQGDATVEDVLARLTGEAWRHVGVKEKVRGFLGSFLGSVDQVSVEELTLQVRDGMFGTWQQRGARLLADLASSEKPVVLWMDELPIFLHRVLTGGDPDAGVTAQGRRTADTFLSWLREQILRHTGRIRLVVTGSIGLENVLELASLSATANYLLREDLLPWSRDEARICLERLALGCGITLSAEANEAILDHLGLLIPHHVQLLFDLVESDSRRRRATHVTHLDVAQVYRQGNLLVRAHRDLVHYEERLLKVLAREQVPVALALLTAAATDEGITLEQAEQIAAREGGASESAAVTARHLVRLFLHDGYLARSGDTLRFASWLLRDWWRARFGLLRSERRGT